MEVFIVEKLCRKKSTEVAVKGENQILSVKKNSSQPTSSEEGEPRRGVRAASRQLASAGVGGGGGGEGKAFPEHFGRRTGWLGWVAVAAPSQSCADSPGKQQPGQALPGLARSIILTLRMKGGDGEGVQGSGWLLIRETEAMA